MAEVLYQIDLAVFYFFNQTLQNALFDVLMPVLTDLNKKVPVLVAVGAVWIWMVVKGGTAGRTAALLLVVTIAFSDQLNSSWVKHLFERVRPCHTLPDVRLLVSCGSGYSFPSSHAVNNFAAAAVLSYFYRKWTWAFATFASLVAFSRVYVGVHYPSDTLAGAVLGGACGAIILLIYFRLSEWRKRHRALKEANP